MIAPSPAALREIVDRYERLAADVRRKPAEQELKRALEDAAYTLCVVTGTQEPAQALAAAKERLRDAEGLPTEA
ncbi:DUF5133 domain-containing protein [Streptomyces sp. NPDC086023]|uniref:DUF5133 domain-containing protein n=1 Tax=Streptomyces sp. NPDC086023 TaxID=3365746 RepID=UPI0037D49F12